MEQVCRKCLLEDFGESELLKSVQDYIALLSEEDKAEDSIREKRLNLCRVCPNLLNGMCRVCGCFVEARTAKKYQSCPDSPPKW